MKIDDFNRRNLVGGDFSEAMLAKRDLRFIKTGIKQSRICFILIILYSISIVIWLTLHFGIIAILVNLINNPITFFTVLLPPAIFFGILLKAGIPTALLTTTITATVVSVIEVALQSADIVTGTIAGIFLAVLLGLGFLLTAISVALCLVMSEKFFAYGILAFVIFSLVLASMPVIASEGSVKVISISISIVSFILIFSFRIATQALKDSPKFGFIQEAAITIASLNGTSFRNADLTDVDFTGANVRNTDFRGANITRAYWLNVKNLNLACLDKTYLANPVIRQLVTSGNGQNQNFDGLNLEGINLSGFNLKNSSFIRANLSNANLTNADLSESKLKKVQLDGANLTSAILTGATIEDWGITASTKLNKVQCEYIFMRLETADNPNRLRKPDHWADFFKEGEFADFIQPYFDTLDLYHRQDVDPRSISIALKHLAEDHPDAQLKFVAIEWRGNGLNIRYTTAPDVDKSELSHDYFTNYARIRKELLGSIQLRLAAQDAEINRMEGVINKFIQTGTHKSTIQAKTIQMIQGEFAMTENRDIHINTGDNAKISGLSSGDGIVNLGTMSGNVTNAINQLPDSPEHDQANLKTLLTQLQQVIETDGDLSEPDKADLLEQVQSLAEAKHVEEPVRREGIARKAMKMFDATLKSLPETAKIVDACSRLLPLILKALGLPA